MKSHHSKTLLAGFALAGLMSGSAVRVHASTGSGSTQLTGSVPSMGLLADDSCKGKHDCKGQNACKGQGGCKGADNSCKGKNDCKGKGGCNTNKKSS